MKYILSLIALAYLIQFSFSADVPSVTVQEDGIISDFSQCVDGEDGKKKLQFSISVKTEGFTKQYQFNMPLLEPEDSFASCTVGGSSQSRLLAETEYMDCVIDTTLFPISNTKVSLVTNYGGDGNFEVLNWIEVIGKQNVIIEYKSNEGCHPAYGIIFTPSENLIDTCTDEESHTISIQGEYTGELKGALTFVGYYIVGEGSYKGNTCTLSEPSSSSGKVLELKCYVKDVSKLRFFETVSYDETAKVFILIHSSIEYELKDCSKTEPDPEPTPDPDPTSDQGKDDDTTSDQGKDDDTTSDQGKDDDQGGDSIKPSSSSSFINLSALLLLSLLF